MKFTRATPEKAAAPLLMIELRADPFDDEPCQWNNYIQICGPNTNGVYESLDGFIQKYMRLAKGLGIALVTVLYCPLYFILCSTGTKFLTTCW